MDTVFAPELQGLDRQAIRDWYNGYNWLGEAVYNPFDVLLLFDKREFRPYWFETGTPTFLVEWLRARGYFTPQLEETYADDALLSSFDVESIQPEAMLWQTGYLTFQERIREADFTINRLRLPNLEVRMALNRALLAGWTENAAVVSQQGLLVRRALAQGDTARFRQALESLYATIPHDWYRANPITQYEGYWASVFYSHLAALGLELIAEDVTNHGCIDLTVKLPERIYLFEFKVVPDQATGQALAQLRAKAYADKYRADGRPLHLVGIEFSRQQRNVVGLDVA
ncbi:PD-(D/E)XK nuclease superfamily protein [Tepidimonas charontis]|uniref:PD-(D/E)XK nuclease superfamily protein n=1 Tax=Tepidimonas charontis TaxID=2267262 RepID=A0A554X109_9BURK|nr:PD-(D/E)XK nuclease superfamily protein [Tepidimonas charontis]